MGKYKQKDQDMCWNDSFSPINKSRLHLGNFYREVEEEEIHSTNTILKIVTIEKALLGIM